MGVSRFLWKKLNFEFGFCGFCLGSVLCFVEVKELKVLHFIVWGCDFWCFMCLRGFALFHTATCDWNFGLEIVSV